CKIRSCGCNVCIIPIALPRGPTRPNPQNHHPGDQQSRPAPGHEGRQTGKDGAPPLWKFPITHHNNCGDLLSTSLNLHSPHGYQADFAPRNFCKCEVIRATKEQAHEPGPHSSAVPYPALSWLARDQLSEQPGVVS